MIINEKYTFNCFHKAVSSGIHLFIVVIDEISPLNDAQRFFKT